MNQKPLLVLALLFALCAFAEEPIKSTAEQVRNPLDRKNVIVFEGLGRAGIYSIGYDRLLGDWLTLGIGFASHQGDYFVPFYANAYLVGSDSHHLFATVGGLASIQTATSYSASLGLGYELRSSDGFLFRTAIYRIGNTKSSLAWIGLSFGISF